MNHASKFHKADGPAFVQGQRWTHNNGKNWVTVVRTERFGDGKWDVEVYYTVPHDVREYHKDAWNFQVRYTHEADLHL